MEPLNAFSAPAVRVEWWTEQEDFAVRAVDETSAVSATAVREVFRDALDEAHALLARAIAADWWQP